MHRRLSYRTVLVLTGCRWVDADSIIINPGIPPEVSLPPSDLTNVNFVGTRDLDGLNTGVFFLRITSWAIYLLIETLGIPLYQPDTDLGFSVDQEAMARLLMKEQGGPYGQGYRDGVVYIPRKWINTYEWPYGFDGQCGDMLVHFPGLGDLRWERMAEWLDTVEGASRTWERPLGDTIYQNATYDFWQEYRSAYQLLKQAQQAQGVGTPNSNIQTAARALRASFEVEDDSLAKIRDARQCLDAQMKAYGANAATS